MRFSAPGVEAAGGPVVVGRHVSAGGETPAVLDEHAGGDQSEWLRAAGLLNSPEAQRIFSEFAEPRREVLDRLHRQGYTHAAFETVALPDLLDQPEALLGRIRSARHHLYVEPLQGGRARSLRMKDLSEDDFLHRCALLKGRLGPAAAGYIATVVEAPRLLCHGNVLVSDDSVQRGTIYGEFVDGDRPPVTRPGVTPQYVIAQDPFTQSYRFEGVPPDLRGVLVRALATIPSTESGARRLFVPGHYEIGVAIDDESGVRRPFVHDVKQWR